MLEKLRAIAHSRWYWPAMAAIGSMFITVALYYQYVLEELPCVLCIQVRIWMVALIAVSVLALLFNRVWTNRIAHILTVVIGAGLLDRAYQLLGTERGFVFSDCGFNLGLPAWLSLDVWFPGLFRVEASCGYTPELMFGVTMAEALIVFSALLLIVSLVLAGGSLLRGAH